MHGAINTAFWIGLIYGACAFACAGVIVRALCERVDGAARSAVLVALARRRSAERSVATGAARSAPDGNHGENLKTQMLSFSNEGNQPCQQ
jgi:hypothetical protein